MDRSIRSQGRTASIHRRDQLEIPTSVVTKEVIQAATPGLVSLAESIASSQDLFDKVAAFVGIAGTTGGSSNETTTKAAPNMTSDTESDQVPPSSSPATGKPATSPPSSSVGVVESPMLSRISWASGLLLVLPLFV